MHCTQSLHASILSTLPGGGRVHDGEVLRWERSVPHELRTNLEFAAQEKAILPVAPVSRHGAVVTRTTKTCFPLSECVHVCCIEFASPYLEPLLNMFPSLPLFLVGSSATVPRMHHSPSMGQHPA